VVNWQGVEPVDVLTAGYPCQPFSNAGMRRGASDPRHLWPYIREAIAHLHPRVVVLENVAAHMSLGGPQVVREVTALGYCVLWGIVRAADAGAPHRRARLFIVATANAACERHGPGQVGGVVGRVGAAANVRERQARATRKVVRDRTVQGGRGGQPGTATTTNAVLGESWMFASSVETTKAGQPAPIACGQTPSDSRRSLQTNLEDRLPTMKAWPSGSPNGWGEYAPLIDRWEVVTGRPSPSPVERVDGRWRSSARWIEWSMGLPDGWVTGVPIPYAAQLKALGNGVVPQQAALALRLLEVTA